MGLLIFYLILAIGVSFLCSILEAVLLSISPSFVAVTEKNDPQTGQVLKELKKDIDRPLSAILSLNTIAHTVGAAGVGAQAQVVFKCICKCYFSSFNFSNTCIFRDHPQDTWCNILEATIRFCCQNNQVSDHCNLSVGSAFTMDHKMALQ